MIFFDSGSVMSAQSVYFFINFPFTFYQTAVQTVRNRHGVAGCFQGGIECLCFVLRYTVVIVAGRGGDKVFTGSKIYPFGQSIGSKITGQMFASNCSMFPFFCNGRISDGNERTASSKNV